MNQNVVEIQPTLFPSGITQKFDWEQLDEIVKYLGQGINAYVKELRENGTNPHIIAIARGGMIPATKLSHMLDIPMRYTIHAKSYTARSQGNMVFTQLPELSKEELAGAIFVEDIVDTGDTVAALIEKYEDASVVSLVGKPTGFKRFEDQFIFNPPIFVNDDIWVSFPWEREFKPQ